MVDDIDIHNVNTFYAVIVKGLGADDKAPEIIETLTFKRTVKTHDVWDRELAAPVPILIISTDKHPTCFITLDKEQLAEVFNWFCQKGWRPWEDG